MLQMEVKPQQLWTGSHIPAPVSSAVRVCVRVQIVSWRMSHANSLCPSNTAQTSNLMPLNLKAY